MENNMPLSEVIHSYIDVFTRNRTDNFQHYHPHYEMLYVPYPIAIEINVLGRKIFSNGPCCILVRDLVPHYMLPAECDRIYKDSVIYFVSSAKFRNLDPLLKKCCKNNALHIFNLVDHQQLFSNLMLALNDTASQDEKAETLDTVFFWLMKAEQARKGTEILFDSSDYILKVITWIDENLGRRLTIQEIADHFYVSQDKLRKDFQKKTDSTIGAYITYMRVNHAIYLLSNTAYGNDRIVTECGFESESYFYKLFKKHIGITPREYRLRQKNKATQLRSGDQTAMQNLSRLWPVE